MLFVIFSEAGNFIPHSEEYFWGRVRPKLRSDVSDFGGARLKNMR